MSSMVQDAFDMGLTTSLGGMPKSSLYYDNDDYTDNYNYDDQEIEAPEVNVLKINIDRKRAVLHNDKNCAGNQGNIMQFDSFDDYNQFVTENLSDYEISKCPLCSENIDQSNEITEAIPEIDIDNDEIPF